MPLLVSTSYITQWLHLIDHLKLNLVLIPGGVETLFLKTISYIQKVCYFKAYSLVMECVIIISRLIGVCSVAKKADCLKHKCVIYMNHMVTILSTS